MAMPRLIPCEVHNNRRTSQHCALPQLPYGGGGHSQTFQTFLFCVWSTNTFRNTGITFAVSALIAARMSRCKFWKLETCVSFILAISIINWLHSFLDALAPNCPQTPLPALQPEPAVLRTSDVFIFASLVLKYWPCACAAPPKAGRKKRLDHTLTPERLTPEDKYGLLL